MLTFASATSGRFEVPQDSFDAVAEEQHVPVHRVDFRDLFPEMFVDTARMPRALSQAWRAAADEAMEKDKGFYTFRGGSTVDFLFHALPESAGRAHCRHAKEHRPASRARGGANGKACAQALVSRSAT